MSSAPEVSVVIPTRNRWPLLCAAGLRAALAQSDVSLEVIVVDDGSERPPPPHPALRDPRVRLVRIAPQRGVAAARNHGVAVARGEWIAFLDDDDLWSPRKLRRQLEVAGADMGLVYGGAVLAGEAGTWPLRLPAPLELRSWLASSSAIPAGASNVLVRSEVARRVGGFDEGFSHLADWDLWIRLEEQTRAVACQDTLVAMRLHDQNMRAASTRLIWLEFRRLAEKRKAAGGEDLDGRALTQWIASQHARSGRRGEAAWWYARAAAAGRNLAFLRQAVRVLAFGDAASAPMVPAPDWLAGYD